MFKKRKRPEQHLSAQRAFAYSILTVASYIYIGINPENPTVAING